VTPFLGERALPITLLVGKSCHFVGSSLSPDSPFGAGVKPGFAFSYRCHSGRCSVTSDMWCHRNTLTYLLTCTPREKTTHWPTVPHRFGWRTWQLSISTKDRNPPSHKESVSAHFKRWVVRRTGLTRVAWVFVSKSSLVSHISCSFTTRALQMVTRNFGPETNRHWDTSTVDTVQMGLKCPDISAPKDTSDPTTKLPSPMVRTVPPYGLKCPTLWSEVSHLRLWYNNMQHTGLPVFSNNNREQKCAQ